jgi:hypothetical protein
VNIVIIGRGFFLDTVFRTTVQCDGTVLAVFSDDENAKKNYVEIGPFFPAFATGESIHEGHRHAEDAWLVNAESTVRVLSRYRDRAINFHPGLLPRYAGLFTYQSAIINGEEEPG